MLMVDRASLGDKNVKKKNLTSLKKRILQERMARWQESQVGGRGVYFYNFLLLKILQYFLSLPITSYYS